MDNPEFPLLVSLAETLRKHFRQSAGPAPPAAALAHQVSASAAWPLFRAIASTYPGEDAEEAAQQEWCHELAPTLCSGISTVSQLGAGAAWLPAFEALLPLEKSGRTTTSAVLRAMLENVGTKPGKAGGLWYRYFAAETRTLALKRYAELLAFSCPVWRHRASRHPVPLAAVLDPAVEILTLVASFVPQLYVLSSFAAVSTFALMLCDRSFFESMLLKLDICTSLHGTAFLSGDARRRCLACLPRSASCFWEARPDYRSVTKVRELTSDAECRALLDSFLLQRSGSLCSLPVDAFTNPRIMVLALHVFAAPAGLIRAATELTARRLRETVFLSLAMLGSEYVGVLCGCSGDELDLLRRKFLQLTWASGGSGASALARSGVDVTVDKMQQDCHQWARHYLREGRCGCLFPRRLEDAHGSFLELAKMRRVADDIVITDVDVFESGNFLVDQDYDSD